MHLFCSWGFEQELDYQWRSPPSKTNQLNSIKIAEHAEKSRSRFIITVSTAFFGRLSYTLDISVSDIPKVWLILRGKMENFCQSQTCTVHTLTFTETHTPPPLSLSFSPSLSPWMNRSLSLNWWSDKVGLNSRRHTGTQCWGRNMCFTSGAPSYTRANVTICMHVCVWENRSATCLCNLLSAFNLHSGGETERGRERRRERKNRHLGRESDNRSVRRGHKVFPYLFLQPWFILFFKAPFLSPRLQEKDKGTGFPGLMCVDMYVWFTF